LVVQGDTKIKNRLSQKKGQAYDHVKIRINNNYILYTFLNYFATPLDGLQTSNTYNPTKWGCLHLRRIQTPAYINPIMPSVMRK
jgi:hypothetical protein